MDEFALAAAYVSLGVRDDDRRGCLLLREFVGTGGLQILPSILFGMRLLASVRRWPADTQDVRRTAIRRSAGRQLDAK